MKNAQNLTDRGIIEYNTDLTHLAREMRNNPTKAEAKIFKHLGIKVIRYTNTEVIGSI